MYRSRRVQCGLNKNDYALWYWSHNGVLGGGRSFQMLITFSFTKLKCVAGASSFCIIPEVGIWKHKIQLVQILALTTFWTLSEFVGFGGFFLWRWSLLMAELWTTFILVVPHNQVWDIFTVSLKSVLAYFRLCSGKLLEESMPLTLRKKILIKLLDFLSYIQPFSTRGWGRRRWTHCCSHSKRCI